MRTLSVKETAQALGISVRTVQYRLQNGELKGMRATNQYGVKEWRVWPNKEIIERLGPGKANDNFDLEQAPAEFLGGDSSAVVDAEAIEHGNEVFADSETPIKFLVRELTQQFAEQLSREKELISQLQRDLEDKDRQLRLLPDLEKQAEARRKEAELKELEGEALKKQIVALQEQLELKAVPDIRQQVEENLKEKDRELIALKEQLATLGVERQKAEALEARVIEMQQSKLELEKSMQEEIERLRQDKETQGKTVQDQLGMLTKKLERMGQPWWKRWFTAAD